MSSADVDLENPFAQSPAAALTPAPAPMPMPARELRTVGGLMISAMSGLAAHTGFEGQVPECLGTLHTDFTVPYFAATQILAALHHRSRTGDGSYLELSQYESAVRLLDLELARPVQPSSALERATLEQDDPEKDQDGARRSLYQVLSFPDVDFSKLIALDPANPERAEDADIVITFRPRHM